MGLNDEEAALVAGISDMTMTLWRRDPLFVERIKRAVALRLYKRLQRIELGVDGWQGTSWCLERQFPTRFSKPEVQISLSNSFNQTTNMLSITIAPEEIREIEAAAEPVRESVRMMYDAYKLSQRAGGNGEGQRTMDVEVLPAKPVAELAPISTKAGSERPEFWRQFCGSDERPVSKDVAIYVVATIVNEAVGRGIGNQAIVEFKNEPVTIANVLSVIEKLCGGPVGFQHLQKRAGYIASP
jgi:hypothetical protein